MSGTAAWTRAEDGGAVVVDMAVGRPLALSPSGTAVWADPMRARVSPLIAVCGEAAAPASVSEAVGA